MNSKIIWSIIVFFSIILTCIALLFLRKENLGYKDDKMKEDAKSSKTIEKTTESSLRKNFDDESTIIQKPQEESSQKIEDIEQSKSDEESTPKVNTPIIRETIDKPADQSNVGEKVMLNVSPQVQHSWNTCAPTTVSMILSTQGITVSQEILAREMQTDETFGTHNVNAIQILNYHLFGYVTPQDSQAGYRLETVTTSDVNSKQMHLFKKRLKQNIADGYPMYYTFDCAKIYPGSYGEHNVIGIGYQLSEDGSDIAYLYYIDPSYTKQDPIYGGLKKVTPEELFEAMLSCVEPNYAW